MHIKVRNLMCDLHIKLLKFLIGRKRQLATSSYFLQPTRAPGLNYWLRSGRLLFFTRGPQNLICLLFSDFFLPFLTFFCFFSDRKKVVLRISVIRNSKPRVLLHLCTSLLLQWWETHQIWWDVFRNKIWWESHHILLVIPPKLANPTKFWWES